MWLGILIMIVTMTAVFITVGYLIERLWEKPQFPRYDRLTVVVAWVVAILLLCYLIWVA